jgi:hypothetical protein
MLLGGEDAAFWNVAEYKDVVATLLCSPPRGRLVAVLSSAASVVSWKNDGSSALFTVS